MSSTNTSLLAQIAELKNQVVHLTEDLENFRLQTSPLSVNRGGDEQLEKKISMVGARSQSPPSEVQEHRPTSRNITRDNLRWARVTDLTSISEIDEDKFLESGNSDLGSMESDPSVHATDDKIDVPSTEITPVFDFVPPMDLTGKITRDGKYPIHGGGFADVYTGFLSLETANIQKVAIKVIRSHTYNETNQWKIEKRLRREIRVWSCLKHDNVLPLLGVTSDFGPYTAMVCPWIATGSLYHFLGDNKETLTMAIRLKILTDVSEGLAYLHSQSVIHGDLTTANILINDERKALLSDFGLSNLAVGTQDPFFMSSTVGGSPRWAAPELYCLENDVEHTPVISKTSDVYSFGSVMLQVITGRIPYHDIAQDVLVIMELISGKHPRRPPEPMLTDKLWNFIRSCWHADPLSRPGMKIVQMELRNLQDEQDKVD